MPRPSRLILTSLLFNLPFALLGVHCSAFDTYVHIFLADHYRARWWDLWEPRWYMGFSVASYPPLVHQLIALLSWPLGGLIAFFAPRGEAYPGEFRWQGEETAYAVVLLAALSLFPLAVRASAQIFVSPPVAARAGWLAIALPALSLTAWAFGQLPTVAATSVVLFALARGYAFTLNGRWPTLAQAVTLAAVAGALHHGVFLFVPFAGLAVSARVAYDVWRARPTHWAGRWQRPAWRFALWAGLSGLSVALVLWPFLAWNQNQTLQTSIDHASRHNFLLDLHASAIFFWPVYGPLLFIAGWAMYRSVQARWLWPLLGLSALLFILGLGGTTPLPRWLYSAGWEWLTYDRFALWAALMLLPLAALWWSELRGRPARVSRIVFGVVLVGWAGVAGWLSILASAQPPALDLAPLVTFLNQPAQRPYRYLTLGFGDQFTRLSALTENGTPDGNYHTARGLPELRASGLGALDTALWNPRGVTALVPFLCYPHRYGLRWVFASHPAYEPVLVACGWVWRGHLGRVAVWEYPGVAPVNIAPPASLSHSFIAYWWGLAPLTALGLCVLVNLHRRARRF